MKLSFRRFKKICKKYFSNYGIDPEVIFFEKWPNDFDCYFSYKENDCHLIYTHVDKRWWPGIKKENEVIFKFGKLHKSIDNCYKELFEVNHE